MPMSASLLYHTQGTKDFQFKTLKYLGGWVIACLSRNPAVLQKTVKNQNIYRFQSEINQWLFACGKPEAVVSSA